MLKTKQTNFFKNYPLSLFLAFCVLALFFLLISGQPARAECVASGGGCSPGVSVGVSNVYFLPAVSPVPVVPTPSCGLADGQSFDPLRGLGSVYVNDLCGNDSCLVREPYNNPRCASNYWEGVIGTVTGWSWRCGIKDTRNLTVSGPFVDCSANALKPNDPYVQLSASPSTVPVGGSTTLTWDISRNSFRSCFLHISSEYSEFLDLKNSLGCSDDRDVRNYPCAFKVPASMGRHNQDLYNLGPVGKHVYAIDCYYNSTNQVDTASVNVQESSLSPTVTLSADPSFVSSGDDTTLTWNVSNASGGCTTGAKIDGGIEGQYNNQWGTGLAGQLAESSDSPPPHNRLVTLDLGVNFVNFVIHCYNSDWVRSDAMARVNISSSPPPPPPVPGSCDPDSNNCGETCPGSDCYNDCGDKVGEGTRDCDWQEVRP